MARALQVAILGSVEPRENGNVIGVPAGRQRALLTLLALRAPQPVSADSAADALWPRAAPEEAMRSLHVTVSRLRRSLGTAGSALETVASGYRLAVEPDAIDARRFETLIGFARAARLEGDGATARRLLDDAHGLWRGPALARNYAERLEPDAEGVRDLEEINADVGVRWVVSFLTADKLKSYCLYEASSPDAILAAARRAGLPADVIVEVESVEPAMFV